MPKAYVPQNLKTTVSERARRRCEYCKSPERYSPSPFAVEHILPEDKGGPTTEDNLAWSCMGCNHHKHTCTESLDPETGFLTPLFNPRTQRWSDHFGWSEDFLTIVGLTPTGRATVERLQLNRENLLNLRELLLLGNFHPPPESEPE
jgi:hypothetical protein